MDGVLVISDNKANQNQLSYFLGNKDNLTWFLVLCIFRFEKVAFYVENS